jgi:hypothetical protein
VQPTALVNAFDARSAVEWLAASRNASGASFKVRIGKAEAKRTIKYASGGGASPRQQGSIQEMVTNLP